MSYAWVMSLLFPFLFFGFAVGYAIGFFVGRDSMKDKTQPIEQIREKRQ